MIMSEDKLMKAINYSNLHKEIITDKNGNKRTVWVSNKKSEIDGVKSGVDPETPSKKKSVSDKQKPVKQGGGKSKIDRVSELLKTHPNLSKEEVILRLKHKVPMVAENVQWILSEDLVCKFTDSKGRKQAIYTEKHWEEASKLKYERLTSSAKQLPRISKDCETILKSGIIDKKYCIALAVKLMEKAYFRVGNEDYTEIYGTYGITTIRPEHFSMEGSKAVFRYVGKKSVNQTKTISDSKLKQHIMKVTSQENYNEANTFLSYDSNGTMKSISSNDVREFLKEYGIKPKDFRTYGANNLFLSFLRELPQAETLAQRKKNVKKAIDNTAVFLGHTPSVCKKSYLFVEYIDLYMNEGKVIK